jgi:hypothetical protein
MMRREKMKDRKRTGANMVRERRDSRISRWGVEGCGREGEEADLIDIVEVSCADADAWCWRWWSPVLKADKDERLHR